MSLDHIDAASRIGSLRIDRSAVDASLAGGRTLPYSFYTSDEIARVEDELIWKRAWQPVGVEPEIRNPGDYLTSRIAGTFFSVPVVVVRDDRLELRAFVNVCRHRGHSVVDGHGSRRLLRCPYHGWTYGLDGCLRGVPRYREGELPPFGHLGLKPLAVATWAGYIFVALDPVESLEDHLGEFPDVLADHDFALPFAAGNAEPDHEYVRDRKTIFTGRYPGNWKVVVENNIECYHCPSAHRDSFCELYDTDPTHYLVQNFDRGMYHRTAYRPEFAERLADSNPIGEQQGLFFAWLWPNVTVSNVATEMGFGTAGFDRYMPDGIGATVIEGTFMRLPSSPSPTPAGDLAADIAGRFQETLHEDLQLTGSVQAGLRSGVFDAGYTLPESERTIRHFQRLTWDALAPAFS